MLTPGSGPPGTQVVIALSGLDSDAVTGAKIGDAPASIVARGPGAVTLTVPGGAVSNPVTLLLGEETRFTPVSFEVTRLISISISGEFPGITEAGSFFGDAAGGQVPVARGRASLVFASDGGDGPALLAFVTDADPAVTLNAATTARALLFLSPSVYTVDPVEGAERLQTLADLDEVTALASIIKTGVQAGQDYSKPLAFGEHVEVALHAYLAQAYSPAGITRGARTAARGSAGVGGYRARDLKVEPKLDRIQPTTHSEGFDDRTGLPILRQKFGAAPLPDPDLGKFLTANPLESAANLYALNISDARLNTRAKALALGGSYTEIYNRLSPEALDRLIIASEPATRYINLVDFVKKLFGKLTTGTVGLIPGVPVKSELNIPDDAPGLYMVRSFNGARFDRQDTLLNNLPGGRAEHTKMLALNIVLAVNDALSFIITDQVVANTDWAKYLVKLEKNVADAIALQSAQGTLDADAIRAILLAAVKTASEFIFDKAKKGLLKKIPGQMGEGFEVVLKRFDRVHAAAKFVERVNAMTNAVQVFNDNVYTIQSVEDTLLIVGDPWAPQVTGFHPQKGRRGTQVTITGTGFSSVLEENIVTIGYSGTSPEAPPGQARAQVLQKSDNNLLVRIPNEANTGVITVHVIGKGTAGTSALEPPFQQFEVIPDPVLIAMDPVEARPGQRIRLIGTNFPPVENSELNARLYAVFTLASESTQVPLTGTATELMVNAPFNDGAGTVHLRYDEFSGANRRESNALNFSVVAPENPQQGAEIRFVVSVDNNVRDNLLTLREALMLKNGTLAYSSLTFPPDPRPPGTSYETDYLSSSVVGNSVRNTIVRRTSGTETLTLTSSLPPLGNWTTLAISRSNEILPAPYFVIDGAGTAHGFVLDNVRRCSIHHFHLRNFSGAAFLLTGGSQANLIDFCSVEGGTGHGVHFLHSARSNIIGGSSAAVGVAVKGVGGNGYYLSGPEVLDNELVVGKKPGNHTGFIEGCGGWGIRIDNGARLNRIRAPRDPIFVSPVSAGLIGNLTGGILVTGEESAGNTIHQMFSVGLPIRDNGGPGIRIESPQTTVFLCRVTGNAGNGIEVIGNNAAGTRIGGCTIGYDWETGLADKNTGHGIHLTNTTGIDLGEFVNTEPGADVPFNGIGGNTGHGILIENSNNITVRSTLVGRVPSHEPTTTFYDLPNAISGVVVQNSFRCVFGSSWFHSRLQVTGHLNGTGLRLAGAQTTDNTVIGCYLGYDSFDQDTDLGNNIGLEVIEGAWGNRIGMRGGVINSIYYNRMAGVVLDSGIDPSQSIPRAGEPFEPRGRNVMVNNRVQQQHEVGVLIKANAKAVRVGGAVAADANTISGNGKVSLKIDGATATDLRPELANRVIGNTMFGHGFALPAADPVGGVAEGAGILVLNSQNQRIGGDRVAEGNTMGNGWVGVMVQGGKNNFIAHNKIGTMRKTGILLRDTLSNLVGPNNEITDCGLAGFGPLGGLVLSGGNDNKVLGNRIGSLRNGTARPILGDGVLVSDSDTNVIGGHGSDGNIITNASGYGVRLTGAFTTDNLVAGNRIGENPGPGAAVQPNAGGGVVLDAGANLNLIGGELPVEVDGAVAWLPAGNFIRHNTGEGVRVAGGTTVSNSITDNSITANGGVGIFHAGGGNNNLPAPSLTAVPGRIEGTASAPNGSTVQFFWDTGGEGGTLLGETQVNQGVFQFDVPPLLPHHQVTATVTSAFTADTSQFAIPVTVTPPEPFGLRVTRFGGAPVARSAAPGVTLIPLPLQFEMLGAGAVRVTRLQFDFTGTAPGSVSHAALYHDANRNGYFDAGDRRVGNIITDFPTGAEFTGPLVVVQPEEPSRLLAVLTLAPGASNGQMIEFQVVSAAGVTASALLGSTPGTVTGTFPVVSDRITVMPSAPPNDYTSWAGQFFTLDELTGIGAPASDAEGDRRSNLFEYFAGSDPRVHDGSPLQLSSDSSTGRLSFTHLMRPDIVWEAQESTNLSTWGPLNFGALLAPEALGDGSVRETVGFGLAQPGLFFRVFVELTGP